LSELEKENQELMKRVDALENVVQKQGLSTSTNADPPVSAMTDFSISGFATVSYFHDSSDPPAENGHISPGYLWNRKSDNLSINKFKLTFASPPAVKSGDVFDVAYRASFIAGQDAPIVNSGSGTTGFDYLREAYLEFNVPVGSGLNVKAGELISLLNYESGDGGAANNNFSQGFQWFFTGNGPSTAVQVGYDFTDKVGIKLRVQNGLYAGPVDNNSSKTFVGALDLSPTKDIWINLLGWGGREDSFAQEVVGGSLLGGWQATSALNIGTELDYFNFYNKQNVTPPGHSSVYSGGLFVNYDFTKEVGLGIRAEYLSDSHGVDASGSPISAAGTYVPGGPLGLLNPPGTGQDITSVAVTLNYKPLPRVKIQPEVRWDFTSWSHGWDPSEATPAAGTFGKQNRFIFGAGASYIF